MKGRRIVDPIAQVADHVPPLAERGDHARFLRRRHSAKECGSFHARAERWRPYRTVASWYLWRATELPQP